MTELKLNSMHLKIDKKWSLFLDRDGVINERLPGDYVKSWEQFHFIEGTLNALKIFSDRFNRILVVTNQQGIGKKVMSADDLLYIHTKMQKAVSDTGGRIDKVYYSPFLDSARHHSRKPSVGMGLMAKHDFRDIIFRKSIMAGDSPGDMLFGKRLGMNTVLIGNPDFARRNPELVDFVFPDLITFANEL